MNCYSFFKNKTFYFVVRHIFLIFGEEWGGCENTSRLVFQSTKRVNN
ncbi:hypothetical protein HMPREF6485_2363 [Segatella buccae ATCC 33574]|uniref:Uncharacterized protein n=1 Tax=Segatella buccae ATCC 33574 TaxID=873513 RepID=E6K9R9_9BACT|nr:hypothetical protein HMPREF6485_2363 [Segatella buccae ATCC 33574]